MTCIIVDDEPLAVRLLESFVAKTPGLQLLGSYTDPIEAINAVKAQQPHLLFLDIQMPDLSGMDLARMIPSGTRVIFTTAFKEYAYESYEVKALDFLLKPIRYNKFMAAVEKAREWFKVWSTVYGLQFTDDYSAAEGRAESGRASISTVNCKPSTVNHNTIFLRVDGEYRQVAIQDILYVSGLKDYVKFFLTGGQKPLITHLTMKAVEEMLPSELFMRVHRSYIVALDKIRKVDRNDCIYIGEEIIRVTDAFRDTFLQYINTRKA